MNWIAILVQLLPAVEAAVNEIITKEGVSPEQATAKLIDHITPGQPNTPSLESANPA